MQVDVRRDEDGVYGRLQEEHGRPLLVCACGVGPLGGAPTHYTVSGPITPGCSMRGLLTLTPHEAAYLRDALRELIDAHPL